MAYVIKIGDQYIGQDGHVTLSQRDALRIDDEAVKTGRTNGQDVRVVHLKARDTNDDDDEPGL